MRVLPKEGERMRRFARWLYLVLILFPVMGLLVGCVRPKPPNPIPSPTPVPPSLSPLRIVGGIFVPELKGAIVCCDDPRTPSVDEGLRDGWPMMNVAALDRISGASVNFAHVRPGPYSRGGLQGTQYAGKEGTEVLPDLRAFVVEANRRGIYVEISVIDNWTFASHPDQGLYGDDCSVTQVAPGANYLGWVDALVSSTGDLQVLYNLGNEGFRCKPSAVWEDGFVAKIREVEAARGWQRHLVGSEWWLPDVRTTYDYVAIGDVFFRPPSLGTPITASYTLNVPLILVEDDGGWHPPSQWRDVGSIVWRGIMSDSEFLAALKGQDAPPYPCPVPEEVSRINVTAHYGASTLTVDGTPKHACPEGNCDYGPETPEGWTQRIVCESERGYPYVWTFNGVTCDPWAKPTSQCFHVGNPLQVRIDPAALSGTVTVCAKGGASGCGSVRLAP